MQPILQERISDAELAILEILWEQAPLTATDVATDVLPNLLPVRDRVLLLNA